MVRLSAIVMITLLGFAGLIPVWSEQPPSLRRAGEVFLVNGNASGLARYGDYLYMVLNESTHPLVVYDIRQPDRPRVLRHLPAPGWPMRCRIVAPGWLWTVHGNGEGFFDLSEPAHPKLVNDDRSGPPLRYVSRMDFRVHPNFTYITCAWQNILCYGTEKQTTVIYDISDPKNPRRLAELSDGVPSQLYETWLFLSGTETPVTIYDISDPARPKLVGRIVGQSSWPFSLRGSAVAWEQGRLYVGIRRDLPKWFGRGPFEQAQTGVAVFEVKDWQRPQLLGYAWIEDMISDVTTLACKGGFVFASDAGFGLRVFDARQPERIREVAADRQGGELSAAVLLPKRRLLALGQNLSGSVFLVDVKDPAHPRLLGYYHHGLRVWGQMACSEDERYVYFQGDISRPRPGLSALFTLDVHDPQQPRLAHVITDVGRAYGLLRLGQHLYSSDGDIFDLSQPQQPRKLPSRLPARGYQIAHYQGHLYLAHFAESGEQGRLYILRLDTPERAEVVGRLDLPLGHRVISLAFLHGRLYLGWAERTPEGRRPRGLVIEVDISDPRNPKLLRRFDPEKDLNLTGHYCHLGTDGQHLVVGSYHRKVGIYDVSDGKKPPNCLALVENLPSAWWMVCEKERSYRVCLDRLLILEYLPR
ncbi:MAG: hypothetical protein NZM42_13775 [Gemmatales bacterium]|nr:hypothetical protein [Gemmatales bacterium]